MTLLLFAHKAIKLALEFRFEMCMIDCVIILVMSGCCSLLIPRKGQLSSEDPADKDALNYLAPKDSFAEVMTNTDFGIVWLLITFNIMFQLIVQQIFSRLVNR